MGATTLVRTSADPFQRIYPESWLSQIEQQALLRNDLVKSGPKRLPLPKVELMKQWTRKLSKSEPCADVGSEIQVCHDVRGQPTGTQAAAEDASLSLSTVHLLTAC